MDRDEKLVSLLEHLGEGADVDVASSLLEANAWDLEAVLNILSGQSQRDAPATRTTYDADGVRAPMATGYRDRLIGPENDFTEDLWQSAFESAAGAGSRNGRALPTHPDDDLQCAMLASALDYDQRADSQEQNDLAAAVQASQHLRAEQDWQLCMQSRALEAQEQQALAQAVEASYREGLRGDEAFRRELELALKRSTAEGVQLPRPASGSRSSPSRPELQAQQTQASTLSRARPTGSAVLQRAGSTTLIRPSAAPSTGSRPSTRERTKEPPISSKSSSSSSTRTPALAPLARKPAEPPSRAVEPAAKSRVAVSTLRMPVATAVTASVSPKTATSAAAPRAAVAATTPRAVPVVSRSALRSRGAPGQADASREAEEADRQRRLAEAEEQRTKRNEEPPLQQAPVSPAAVASIDLAEASRASARAEALAAAERRWRLEKQVPIEAPAPLVVVPEPSVPVVVVGEVPTKATHESSASVSSVSSALVALKRQYFETDPAALAACLKVLKAYLGNLAKHPQEAKYQSIKKDNSIFCSRVSSLQGATDVLRACGFSEHHDAWVVEPEYLKSKGPALFDALAKVEVLLDQVQAKL